MTVPLTISTDAYEARYGWNGRQIAGSVAGIVLLLACGVLALTATNPASLLLSVLGIVFALLMITLQGLIGFSGKAAIRVDEAGILLGGSPLRYGATTAFIPWADIVAVELWVHEVGIFRKIRYMGLHRAPGAPALNGAGNGRAAALATSLTGKSAELIAASRPTISWRYQPRELLTAVQRFAPQVQIYVEPQFKL